MMVTHTQTVLVVSTAFLLTAEGSWGPAGKGNSHNYDLSRQSDMTKLYNSKVYEADRLTRRLEILPFQTSVLSHEGVRVTLEDGTKWLVHKGDGYGISSQTVVVDATHMSNNWKIRETKDFDGSKTVSDFVAAGGSNYHLIFDNCHGAVKRMMNK